MKRHIIWLPYLDPTIPRRLGRRIPRRSLPRRPRPEEVLEACRTLGLECEVVREKRYPRLWYMDTPMIRVSYNGKKSEAIRLLLGALQKILLSTPS